MCTFHELPVENYASFVGHGLVEENSLNKLLV